MDAENQNTQQPQTPITMEGLMQLIRELNTNKPPPPPPTAWTNSTLNLSEKLNQSNFLIWSRMMHIALGARDRLNHITDDPPPKTDPDQKNWTQKDALVISWIIDNINPDLVRQFLDYPTARELWKGLERTFSSGSDELQIFDLTVKTNTLKQGNESIEGFYSKMVGLWKEIDRRMPNPMETPKDIETYQGIVDRHRLYQFLAGLDETFDKDRRDILNTRPLPSVDTAYATIRREVARRSIMGQGKPSLGGEPSGVGSGLLAKNRSRKPLHGEMMIKPT